jgi:hypothetical protein
MEELKKHLLRKPHIVEVFFNEKEEWLFHPRASYPIKMTREEILGESEEKEEKPEPKKKNDKK